MNSAFSFSWRKSFLACSASSRDWITLQKKVSFSARTLISLSPCVGRLNLFHQICSLSLQSYKASLVSESSVGKTKSIVANASQVGEPD